MYTDICIKTYVHIYISIQTYVYIYVHVRPSRSLISRDTDEGNSGDQIDATTRGLFKPWCYVAAPQNQ